MKITEKIKELVARYDQRRAERKERHKILEPLVDRVNEIREAPRATKSDFFCVTCKKDFSGIAFKQVSSVRPMLPTAWFVSWCPAGHRALRRITDKDTDSYYDQSLVVQRQRYDLRDAFLDPSDPRFRLLYPNAYTKLISNNS